MENQEFNSKKYLENEFERKTLEELTKNLIFLLEKKGKITFEEIQSELLTNEQRIYDLLSILLSLGIIQRNNKKFKGSYFWIGNGSIITQNNQESMCLILDKIWKEQNLIFQIFSYCEKIDLENGKNE
ncbi:e2f-like (mammalian transcription factor) [Anaeramoeba ignava]|uniref:E2f-like (Mammalian transcription factor) n=1 Tax=Anaeramoeba ignava TaxID=1746090 RepID=A0A9Q0LU73_ANAIG|nr:e2f-like (mammalian transcription factor) [Anaeramoeba ignava]